jgi:amino acid transporter
VSLPGRMPVDFYICNGHDPAIDARSAPKFNAAYYVVIAVALLAYTYTGIKVFLFNRKAQRKDTAFDGPKDSFEKRSMQDFATTATALALALSTLALLYTNLTRTNPKDWSEYPFYLLIYWNRLINAPFILSALAILCYIRKPEMGKKMAKVIKDMLRWRFQGCV